MTWRQARQSWRLAWFFHVLAIAMLLISGGDFTHAGTAIDGHVHNDGSENATLSAEHSHTGPVSETESFSENAMVHCGANILILDVAINVIVPKAGVDRTLTPAKKHSGRFAALDPPPPRSVSKLI